MRLLFACPIIILAVMLQVPSAGDTFLQDSLDGVRIEEVSAKSVDSGQAGGFERGGLVSITVDLSSELPERGILLTVHILDSKGVSLGVASVKGALSGGRARFIVTSSIPRLANEGLNTGYVAVFTDWPSTGGVPYSVEKTVQFTVR